MKIDPLPLNREPTAPVGSPPVIDRRIRLAPVSRPAGMRLYDGGAVGGLGVVVRGGAPGGEARKRDDERLPLFAFGIICNNEGMSSQTPIEVKALLRVTCTGFLIAYFHARNY